MTRRITLYHISLFLVYFYQLRKSTIIITDFTCQQDMLKVKEITLSEKANQARTQLKEISATNNAHCTTVSIDIFSD